MSSGQKKMVFNTLERAVSTDHNRLQAFLGKSESEFVRWMLLAQMTEGGAASVGSAQTDPLTAVIVNGLWARPEIGTVNLFVEPGCVAVLDPNAVPSADDSPVKLITDPGVQTAATLTLTAGGGGTRLDVIEFRRLEETLDESASRDIYNEATGEFTATLVDKVRSDKLEYRIRTGTPGGGFPGTALGWLPIAVASVPNTALTWNDVIVWDVRPLMMDMVRSPAQVLQTFPHFAAQWASKGQDTGPHRISGIVEAERRQFRVGGDLGPVNAGYTNGQIPFTSADFLEGGFAVTANRPWYLYAMLPNGLPRWCRYSPSSSGFRVPLAPRGVLVFSQKAPTNGALTNTAAITMPTTLGFTSTVNSGTPLVTGGYDDVAGAVGDLMDGIVADGWTRFGKAGVLAGAKNGILLAPATGVATQTVTYDLIDNTTHPVGAVAVRLRVTTAVAFADGPDKGVTMRRKVRVFDPALAEMLGMEEDLNLSSGSAGTMTYTFEVDIPLNTLGTAMPGGLPVTRRVEVDLAITGGGVLTFSNQRAFVIGWKLGVGA